MNVADSRRLAAALEHLGCAPVQQPGEADVIVLNTCVVRQPVEDKIYGYLSSLRPLKARRPDVVIALMGCLVGRNDPSPLQEQFPWVDVFMGPSETAPLIAHLGEKKGLEEGQALEAVEAGERAQAYAGFVLPVQERGRLVSAPVPAVLGCSHACTYCVIPYRRGPERSRPAEEVLAEARALAAQGVKEVTLLGQIIDRYGHDLPPEQAPDGLVGLLRRLHGIEGLERIRFSTSHPNWVDDDLIRAVAALPRVCEHIEVPVQAGDDEVLARMRRGYTAADYRRLVHRMREIIPDVSITTDVIVGFPGETEAQFQRTYDLLAELRLDKVHIARYSPRPRTVASRTYPDDVPPEEKERRRKALDDLQREILTEINGGLLGRTVEVLVQGKDERKGRWWGRTRRNRLVFFPHPDDLLGRLVEVRITWTGPWSLIGEVQSSG